MYNVLCVARKAVAHCVVILARRLQVLTFITSTFSLASIATSDTQGDSPDPPTPPIIGHSSASSLLTGGPAMRQLSGCATAIDVYQQALNECSVNGC